MGRRILLPGVHSDSTETRRTSQPFDSSHSSVHNHHPLPAFFFEIKPSLHFDPLSQIASTYYVVQHFVTHYVLVQRPPGGTVGGGGVDKVILLDANEQRFKNQKKKAQG